MCLADVADLSLCTFADTFIGADAGGESEAKQNMRALRTRVLTKTADCKISQISWIYPCKEKVKTDNFDILSGGKIGCYHLLFL